MSTIGAKVQSMPAPAASNAATRAVCSARPGSKLATSPTGMGKMVRWPWITSAANISGILRRDRAITARCMRCAITDPLPLNTPVSRPATASAICVSKLRASPAGLSAAALLPPHAAARRVSCPAFSSRVIVAIRRSMAAASVGGGARRVSACNGLATQAVVNASACIAARRDMPASCLIPASPPICRSDWRRIGHG